MHFWISRRFGCCCTDVSDNYLRKQSGSIFYFVISNRFFAKSKWPTPTYGTVYNLKMCIRTCDLLRLACQASISCSFPLGGRRLRRLVIPLTRYTSTLKNPCLHWKILGLLSSCLLTADTPIFNVSAGKSWVWGSGERFINRFASVSF